MKGDGVLNLLIFQAFQDVRMASSLVRSTTETLDFQGVPLFYGWLDVVRLVVRFARLEHFGALFYEKACEIRS